MMSDPIAIKQCLLGTTDAGAGAGTLLGKKDVVELIATLGDKTTSQ